MGVTMIQDYENWMVKMINGINELFDFWNCYSRTYLFL